MKYDFTSILDRKGKDAIALDVVGAPGSSYPAPRQEYFDAIIRWQQRRNGITLSRPQGTYMLFIDCEKWLAKTGKTMDELMKLGWDVGVVWQDGRDFHGKTHIRLNLALPLSRVQEAFGRLDKYVFNA